MGLMNEWNGILGNTSKFTKKLEKNLFLGEKKIDFRCEEKKKRLPWT